MLEHCKDAAWACLHEEPNAVGKGSHHTAHRAEPDEMPRA